MDTVPAKYRQHLTVGALSVAATRVVPELMQHMYTYKQGTGLSSGLHLMPRGPVEQIASDVLTHFPHFQVYDAFAKVYVSTGQATCTSFWCEDNNRTAQPISTEYW